MTTPVEEIRKAIEVLRCDHEWPINPPEGSITRPGHCRNCGIPWRAGPLVADELIEPLVSAMEAVAFCVEMDADLIHRVGYEHILATARAIRGGDGS